jgi:hypothetical protein
MKRLIRFAVLAVTTLLVAVSIVSPIAQASSSDTRSDVDKHTRAYVKQVRGCVAIARLSLSLASKQSTYAASDTIKKAADICDAIRSRLASMSTDHFDKQATTAWAGVDRLKSGLNATLAFIDTRYPSKLTEAKNKLAEGRSWTRIGIRGINLRRHVYGLGSI